MQVINIFGGAGVGELPTHNKADEWAFAPIM